MHLFIPLKSCYGLGALLRVQQPELSLALVSGDTRGQPLDSPNRDEERESRQGGCDGDQSKKWCLTRIDPRPKCRGYETVMKPIVVYGWETFTMSERRKTELDVPEVKLLRF